MKHIRVALVDSSGHTVNLPSGTTGFTIGDGPHAGSYRVDGPLAVRDEPGEERTTEKQETKRTATRRAPSKADATKPKE